MKLPENDIVVGMNLDVLHIVVIFLQEYLHIINKKGVNGIVDYKRLVKRIKIF